MMCNNLDFRLDELSQRYFGRGVKSFKHVNRTLSLTQLNVLPYDVLPVKASSFYFLESFSVLRCIAGAGSPIVSITWLNEDPDAVGTFFEMVNLNTGIVFNYDNLLCRGLKLELNFATTFKLNFTAFGYHVFV